MLQPKTMNRRGKMTSSLSMLQASVCILCCSHVITSAAARTAAPNQNNEHKSAAGAADAATASAPLDLERISSDLDTWIDQLQSKVSGISRLLQEGQSQAQGGDSGSSLLEPINARRDALAERQAKLLDRIAAINRAQLQVIIKRVNATYEAEVDRRAAWDDTYASCSSSSSSSSGGAASADSTANDPGTCSPPDAASGTEYVSKDSLARVLDRAAIMSQSEKKLEGWTTDLLSASIDEYTEARVAKLSSGADQVDAVAPTSENPDYDAASGHCAALPETASMIHASLQNMASPGGSALFDHASSANGGSIVYGEGRDRRPMTSSPYLVRKSSDDGTRLGDMWWRKFIPEDWENALDWATDGRWYETKVEDLIPMQGHSYSASTVLDTDSDIGACYPISIKEKSRITVRLTYPVLLTGFTVGLNHCDSTAPLINSTDLSIAVEGFQPCWLRLGGGDKQVCERTGYDSRGITLGHFDYDVSTRSRDTFCVSSSGLNEAPRAPSHNEDDEEEEAMSGQCTVSYEDDGPKSSCQDDDDSSSAQSSSASDAMPSLFSGQLLSGDEESAVIEAVSFVFDQNLDWDCICISSIHVHGEPVMR